MSTTDRKLRVFLCHSSADKPIVRELYQRLNQESWIDPWLDERKLLPGQDWQTNIEEAVDSSDVVIVFLSSHSINIEGFVQKEIRYAKEIALRKPEEAIFLVPIRLDGCHVPRTLRAHQWADYFGELRDQTYGNLIYALKIRLNQVLLREASELTHREQGEMVRYKEAEKAREAAEALARKLREEKLQKEKEERLQQERERRAKQIEIDQKRREAAAIALRRATERKLAAEEWFTAGMRSTEMEERIRCFTEAINLNPHDIRAYFNRGAANSEQGNLEAAILDFSESIRLKRDFIEALYYRGSAYYEKGDFGAAISDYDEAIRLKPGFIEALFYRGNAHYLRDELNAAILDYGRVISLNPKYISAYKYRGRARWKMGDFLGGIQDLFLIIK